MTHVHDPVEQLVTLREVAHTGAFRRAMIDLRRTRGSLIAECVHRIIFLRETLPDVCRWLNARMAAEGRHERYSMEFIRSMALDGLAVIYAWWRRRYEIEQERWS